jgi:GntR family transcriptional regulator
MAPDAKFQQIANGLREQIKSESLAPGSRLPSEDDLAEEYSVATNTVRNAARVLEAEGLIVIRPKSGMFVREYKRIRRDANERLATRQWGSGRDIWDVDAGGRDRATDSITVQRETAPSDVATRLGTADVWVRRRRYLIDGNPIQWATSYLPAGIVDGSPITQPNTGAGGIYARLAELGFAPAEFVEMLLIRMPDPGEAEKLALLPVTPVAQLRREAVTAAGRIVEVNDMICAGDAYLFQWRFPAS